MLFGVGIVVNGQLRQFGSLFNSKVEKNWPSVRERVDEGLEINNMSFIVCILIP